VLTQDHELRKELDRHYHRCSGRILRSRGPRGPQTQRAALRTLPGEAGLNRFAWNLRYEDPVKIPGAFFENDTPPKGAFALPGMFKVKLTVAGKSQTVLLELTMDPRATASREDLDKQFDLEQKISRRLTVLPKTINQLRDLRTQVQAMNKKYTGVAAWDPIRSGAEDLVKKLTAIEEQLVQTKIKRTEGDLNFRPWSMSN